MAPTSVRPTSATVQSSSGNLGPFVDPLAHLVALDAGDLESVKTELAGDLGGLLGGAARVGDAHVGDDARSVFRATGQHRAQPALEVGVVPGRWVRATVTVPEGHGALANALEDQEVECAARRQIARRVEPVRREPGPGPNPQHRRTLAHRFGAGARPGEPDSVACPVGTVRD